MPFPRGSELSALSFRAPIRAPSSSSGPGNGNRPQAGEPGYLETSDDTTLHYYAQEILSPRAVASPAFSACARSVPELLKSPGVSESVWKLRELVAQADSMRNCQSERQS